MRLFGCTVVVIQLLFALGQVSHGAEEGKPVSWEEIRRLILRHHPAWPAFRLRGEALAGALQEAALTPRPSVSVELENIVGTGEWEGWEQLEITAAYTKVLEAPEKKRQRMAAVRSQKGGLAAAMKKEQAAVLGEAYSAYLDLIYGEEKTALMGEQVQQAEQLYRLATDRFEAGKIPVVEQQRAEVGLIQAKSRLAREAKELAAKRLVLQNFWQPERANLDLTASGDSRRLPEVPERRVLNRVLAAHPEVQEIEAQIAELEGRAALEMANRRWDLEISGGLRQAVESGDVTVIAEVSRPLKTGALGKGAVMQTNKEIEALKLNKQTVMRLLKGQFEVLMLELENAAKALAVMEKNILPLAGKTARTFQEGYDAGKFSLSEALDAQRPLIEIQLEIATGRHELRAVQGKIRALLALDLFETRNEEEL